MSKNIIIVGGGISGLALLHYLKQGHKDAEIVLFEKNDHLGGTIRSVARGGCLFETGPNGFLDSKKRTLEFAREIGLEQELVRADRASGTRYLSVHHALHPLPTSPKSFLSFGLLNPAEKVRVLGEIFVRRGDDPQESVYDFGKRRFGEKFSQVFLDPMVSGVYAGDARKAVLTAVFPRIAALEREHGSLFRAMFKMRGQHKGQGNGKPERGGAMGSPAGTLTSFRRGIGQAIDQVGALYKESIRLNQEIDAIFLRDGRYAVLAKNGQAHTADELYLCAPAYCAGPLLQGIDPQLARALERVTYAPVAVVGLVCPQALLPYPPSGYGYLIPSSQRREVLGVLFESDIFPGRCGEGQVMLRAMIGGARHPDILKKSREDLVRLALQELRPFTAEGTAEINAGDLSELFFAAFPRAIPQYDRDYCATLKVIEGQLERHRHLHLVANYLK